MLRIGILIVLSTIVYTYIRYAIFGDVAVSHLPVFLFNKSISMASVLFMFLSALNHVKGRREKMRLWGAASFQAVVIHILLSLSILSQSYYPKFFASGKMNMIGELSILFGVLASCCFWRLGSCVVAKRRNGLLAVSILFVVAHLVVMGFSGWLTVEKWHGGLPPISLISFIFAAASFILFLKTDNKAGDSL